MPLKCKKSEKRTDKQGIHLEQARLCTVCWTIHTMEECPGCGARQWHKLISVLGGMMLPNEDEYCDGGRPALRVV